MKLSLIFSLFIFIYSCNNQGEKNNRQEKNQKTKVVSLQKVKVQEAPTAIATPDDFSDLKKKDEKCETEEELLKKEFEQKKKSDAGTLKLQGGGSTGCKVE